MKRLFVDMDGTVVEWRADKTREDTYKKGYFIKLKPYYNVVLAIQEICTLYPEIQVFVLSAVHSDNPSAKAEKNAWLDKYLPEIPAENRLFVPCGTDKTLVCPNISKDDFLLDDYPKNLDKWNEKGTAIKLYNGVNSPVGNGYSVIDKDSNADVITLQLLEAINILDVVCVA